VLSPNLSMTGGGREGPSWESAYTGIIAERKGVARQRRELPGGRQAHDATSERPFGPLNITATRL